jgi:hydroxymethylglutaryl-CoA synthase
MACVDDTEDIHSICLTVVRSLMDKYAIDPSQVGRLEVGTETIVDKSKSVKTVLMQLFPGNDEIEGIDTTNACYGGTNALFNCLQWMESRYYNGKYAICVSADIAVYKSGNARPTGGCGAVAILLGPDAPLVFEHYRGSHFEHQYDFYKPDLHSEYPVVDGPLSNQCYTRALDQCYNRFVEKHPEVKGLEDLDFVLFHSPYSKLVQKSFGRLLYNDTKRSNSHMDAKTREILASNEERLVEKHFVSMSQKDFEHKTLPSMIVNKNVGNMYCASLYGALCGLLSEVEALDGKRIGLFSYGSGLASSFFSLIVKGDVSTIRSRLQVKSKLEARSRIEPREYDAIMALREQVHNQKSYSPVGRVADDTHFKGTYVLTGIDDKFRRVYRVVE